MTMNPNAIESTLARLREMAGPDGVRTHPEFGWFGFLDVLRPPGTRELSPLAESCLTPSTVLSDQSPPPKTPAASQRPSRELYRHPNYHLSLSTDRCSLPHSPKSASPARTLDQVRIRRRIKTMQRKYGKQEVRRWVKTALGTLV